MFSQVFVSHSVNSGGCVSGDGHQMSLARGGMFRRGCGVSPRGSKGGRVVYVQKGVGMARKYWHLVVATKYVQLQEDFTHPIGMLTCFNMISFDGAFM